MSTAKSFPGVNKAAPTPAIPIAGPRTPQTVRRITLPGAVASPATPPPPAPANVVLPKKQATSPGVVVAPPAPPQPAAPSAPSSSSSSSQTPPGQSPGVLR